FFFSILPCSSDLDPLSPTRRSSDLRSLFTALPAFALLLAHLARAQQFRSVEEAPPFAAGAHPQGGRGSVEDARRCAGKVQDDLPDRKSTRLNSSHVKISYAVFCLKK